MLLRQTTFLFQFWFSRSPYTELDVHIGWLWCWKFNFGCGMIINTTDYIKYNSFCDDDGIDNALLWSHFNLQLKTLLVLRVMILCITTLVCRIWTHTMPFVFYRVIKWLRVVARPTNWWHISLWPIGLRKMWQKYWNYDNKTHVTCVSTKISPKWNSR